MADNQQRDPLKEIEGVVDLPQPIDVDLTPKDKDGKPVAAEPAARERKEPAAPKTEDENVVALRRQLAAETRARQEAEARTKQIEADRRRAEEATAEGQLRLITTSLETATSDKARAKADLKSALSNGEHDRIVEAQEALNDAQIRIDRLNTGKGEMERRAAREKDERERQAQQVQTQTRHVPDDPVEALAGSLTAKSAAWVRANPDIVTDPRKNRQMMRAHEDAIDEGLNVESPEYFAYIEKRLGIGHDDGGDPPPRQRQASPRRDAAAPAAPVSRGIANDGRGSRENTVTLNPAQRQFCDESGIKYEDYARSLQSLRKEGRLQ